MSFTILAAATPNYAEMLRYTLPSWFKNSGADKILVERLEMAEGSRETAWYDNVAARCWAMTRNIMDAFDRGERVITLDVDCVVLGNLEDGFSDDHPISIARWPNVNMGVMFWTGSSKLPYCYDWLVAVAARVEKNCKIARGKLRKAGGCFLADQSVWEDELHKVEQHVHKLDANVWNFCPLPEKWERDFLEHKDRIKIVHLKGQGQPERHVVPKRMLAEHFPEKL